MLKAKVQAEMTEIRISGIDTEENAQAEMTGLRAYRKVLL